MIPIIFATNNVHKAKEINVCIGNTFQIKTLQQCGIVIDIPEPFETIEENAAEKARVIFKLTGQPCFGEDTGLEVEALNGLPGVKSARYSGDERSSQKNIEKVLFELKNKSNRNAKFKTVISLFFNDQQNSFEGICKGTIIASPKGQNGFGYDSIFIPEGAKKTFAEMDIAEKNIFSHRRKAVDKLAEYLKNYELNVNHSL